VAPFQQGLLPSVPSASVPSDRLALVSQGIVSEARLRSGVLCAVFVHACAALLELRFGELKATEAKGHELHFKSSGPTFRHLLLIVEVSLHLLCLHMTLLTAADLEGNQNPSNPVAGIPRLQVVSQYLRLLIDFASASGGSVALTSRIPGRSSPDAGVVSSLVFAASVASTAEKLVAKLQLQQGRL
ncbi:unnamed protein product, partial [Effrenium voratum]